MKARFWWSLEEWNKSMWTRIIILTQHRSFHIKMMTLWNCSKHLIIEKYNCASFLFMITGTVVQKKNLSGKVYKTAFPLNAYLKWRHDDSFRLSTGQFFFFRVCCCSCKISCCDCNICIIWHICYLLDKSVTLVVPSIFLRTYSV